MLSIGSIVYLKDGTRKLMILNRGPLIESEAGTQMFDYSGCTYPSGLEPEQVFYFNDENIDKVVFEGYHDEEEERFQEIYQSWKKENPNIKRGEVLKPIQNMNISEKGKVSNNDDQSFGF
ncbi:DUF4176 domain-containing protein [Lactococcus allomyrinae]|uniref:DUF4176 domain-containing protein n=1 Tax=Lactococcus allomyrinae TaxID=2419773 RepID=A0A387BD87_9LACT|nr:DUF4176 domain-containing protein [Lactococcus allomyrinae]AYG00458.1 DUF4176 domain-containing protein [Lactococcus allomyrinae]